MPNASALAAPPVGDAASASFVMPPSSPDAAAAGVPLRRPGMEGMEGIAGMAGMPGMDGIVGIAAFPSQPVIWVFIPENIPPDFVGLQSERRRIQLVSHLIFMIYIQNFTNKIDITY